MKKRVSLLMVLIFMATTGLAFSAEDLTCWFAPGWKSKAAQAKEITQALSEKSGLSIRPRIAKSYPEVLTAFASYDQNLVYVGSFVQAIVAARKLGTPLTQTANGKEMYSGILIYPEGQDPFAILKNNPKEICLCDRRLFRRVERESRHQWASIDWRCQSRGCRKCELKQAKPRLRLSKTGGGKATAKNSQA